MTFFDIQTQTGWSRVLEAFADWCNPRPGWVTLDVGSGPGLFPRLLSQRGCFAIGIDIASPPTNWLYPQLIQGDALALPFRHHHFHLVTASNVLFLLPDPRAALLEMVRLLRPGGQIAVLNPSEYMSVSTATELADQRGLQGLARQSLVNWACLAESHQRWDESQLTDLFSQVGLSLTESRVRIGPGLARFARGETSE